MADGLLATIAMNGLLLVLQRPLLLRHRFSVLATFAVEVHRHNSIFCQLAVLNVNLVELVFRPATGIFATEPPTGVAAFPIAVLYQLRFVGRVTMSHEVAGIFRVLLAYLQPTKINICVFILDVISIEGIIDSHFRRVNLCWRGASSS